MPYPQQNNDIRGQAPMQVNDPMNQQLANNLGQQTS